MLDILICTTLERLPRVESLLLPPMEGVHYVVSCQGVDSPFPSPFGRDDVSFHTVRGIGLSRNRNEAIAHSMGDILLFCDDDEHLIPATVRGIVSDFLQHSEWDIILYQFRGNGKRYPSSYVSSVELAVRRRVVDVVRFDERFGLGSEHLACGEEDVFVCDARRHGFGVGTTNDVVCHVDGDTTGCRFLSDPRVQRSKGAVFCYVYGRKCAYYKSVREALSWLLRYGSNPVPLLKNMFWGIRYVGS